jgi:hypothetical protein
VTRIDECALFEVKCVFPQLGNLIHEYDSVADLIYDGQNLGFVLDEHGQGMRNFTELYQAALDYEGCDTLSEALDIAENLNRYELVPLSGLKDYAMEELNKRGVKLSDVAASAFDFDGYAAELMEQKGFLFSENEQAYIGKIGAIPRHDRTMDVLPGMVLE